MRANPGFTSPPIRAHLCSSAVPKDGARNTGRLRLRWNFALTPKKRTASVALRRNCRKRRWRKSGASGGPNQGPAICQEWRKSFLQIILRRWIRAITRMKMQDLKGQPPQRRAAPTPTRISDDRSHRRPQSLIPPSVLIGGHPRFHKNDNVLVPLRHRGGSWSHDHAPRGTAIRV